MLALGMMIILEFKFSFNSNRLLVFMIINKDLKLEIKHEWYNDISICSSLNAILPCKVGASLEGLEVGDCTSNRICFLLVFGSIQLNKLVLIRGIFMLCLECFRNSLLTMCTV